jgi:Tfp pilus assembly protein PilV
MSRHHTRAGFSLMEVLLATAILLGSILVLMELASIGRHYIQSIDDRTTAQLLCQSKLNELLAGAEPLEEADQRAVEDYPDWVYSIELMPEGELNLALLKVTVSQQLPEGQERSVRGKPKRFTLERWVVDPTRSEGQSLNASPGEAYDEMEALSDEPSFFQ